LVAEDEEGGKDCDFAVESSFHHLQFGGLDFASSAGYAVTHLQTGRLVLVFVESPAGEKEANHAKAQCDEVEATPEDTSRDQCGSHDGTNYTSKAIAAM
jgi:hypothetical protein